VSPDRPALLAPFREEKGFAYDLYSDASMAAARAFGIAFRLDDATSERYRGFGVDLEKRSGFQHQGLPVPGVFVVNGEGVIAFTYVNPNYRVRLSSRVLLAAVRAAAGREDEEEGTR
jgi:peroxiredoxin